MEKRKPQGKTGLATFLKTRHHRHESDVWDRRERVFSEDWGMPADSLDETMSGAETAARVIIKHIDGREQVSVMDLLTETGIDFATGFIALNLLARRRALKVGSDDKGIFVSGKI